MDHLGLGLHSYRFILKEDNPKTQVIRGAGSDFSDQTAILKAWGEFVERYVFVRQTEHPTNTLVTSSGFAAHRTIARAKESAIAELIERDAFLVHWLLRLPVLKKDIEVHLSPINRGRRDRAEKSGVRLHLHLLNSSSEFLIGISFIEMGDRFFVETTARKDLRTLANDLFVSSYATANYWIANSATPPLPEIPIDKFVRPIDHATYNMNRATEIRDVFCCSKQTPSPLPIVRIEVDDFSSQDPFSTETGYCVARAVSTELQSLYFGPTTVSKINISRLSQIMGREIDFSELNPTPHCLP